MCPHRRSPPSHTLLLLNLNLLPLPQTGPRSAPTLRPMQTSPARSRPALESAVSVTGRYGGGDVEEFVCRVCRVCRVFAALASRLPAPPASQRRASSTVEASASSRATAAAVSSRPLPPVCTCRARGLQLPQLAKASRALHPPLTHSPVRTACPPPRRFLLRHHAQWRQLLLWPVQLNGGNGGALLPEDLRPLLHLDMNSSGGGGL